MYLTLLFNDIIGEMADTGSMRSKTKDAFGRDVDSYRNISDPYSL